MFAANFQTNATYKLIKGLTVCLPFTFIGIERFPNNARCSAVFRLLIAQLTTVPSSILNALIYSKSSPLYNSFPKQRQFRRNKIFNWFFSFFLFSSLFFILFFLSFSPMALGCACLWLQPIEDISLVLQLQSKIRELEKERRSLGKRIEHLEKNASPTDDPQHAQEMIRVGKCWMVRVIFKLF